MSDETENDYLEFTASYDDAPQDDNLATVYFDQNDGGSFWSAFDTSASWTLDNGSESIAKGSKEMPLELLDSGSASESQLNEEKGSDAKLTDVASGKATEEESLLSRMNKLFVGAKDTVKGAYGELDSEGKKFVWGAGLGLFKSLASAKTDASNAQARMMSAEAQMIGAKSSQALANERIASSQRSANALADANKMIKTPVAAPYGQVQPVQPGLIQQALWSR